MSILSIPLTLKCIRRASKEKFKTLEIAGLRHSGSAALDLAYVAASRIDGYCESYLKAWDIAAGSLIVQEAGGFISGINNNNYLKSGEIIAANPKLFPKLKNVINESGLYTAVK